MRDKRRQFPNGTLGASFETEVQPIGDPGENSALLWLGDRKKATKIVYFLHGGGYFIPLSWGHIHWCYEYYVKPSAAAGVNVACAFLEYTLGPSARFPTQMRQASQGLQTILDEGFSGKDIIVGGDSAGANLTMQLLLHILHPHPELEPVELDVALSAVFLTSPYLSYRSTEFKSFSDYERVDLQPGKKRMRELENEVSAFNGKLDQIDSEHLWALPLDAQPSKIDGLERIVRHIYITYGEYEILADHSIKFVQVLNERAPAVNLVVEPGAKEPHDAVLIEGLSYQKDAPGSLRHKKWFEKAIRGEFDWQASKRIR